MFFRFVTDGATRRNTWKNPKTELVKTEYSDEASRARGTNVTDNIIDVLYHGRESGGGQIRRLSANRDLRVHTWDLFDRTLFVKMLLKMYLIINALVRALYR